MVLYWNIFVLRNADRINSGVNISPRCSKLFPQTKNYSPYNKFNSKLYIVLTIAWYSVWNAIALVQGWIKCNYLKVHHVLIFLKWSLVQLVIWTTATKIVKSP